MSDVSGVPHEQPRILAFDIGIKNLAYCVLEEGQIRAWENVNLLLEERDGTAVVDGPKKCDHAGCKSNASWAVAATASYCLRHVPASMPALKDVSGTLVKKIPTAGALKDLVAHYGLVAAGKKKESYVTALATRFALPLTAAGGGKKKKATETSMEDIHDSIRYMVKNRAEIFKGCTHVLLENQPVFKNPTMKSVQILLFATLREAMIGGDDAVRPSFHFIHAGKKVKGATKGDAGYSERKGGSEARVKEWLNKGTPATITWLRQFDAAQKKSDLADALCMCLDYADNIIKVNK